MTWRKKKPMKQEFGILSFQCSFIRLFTHFFIPHSFVPSFILLSSFLKFFLPPFVRSFVRLLIRPFVGSLFSHSIDQFFSYLLRLFYFLPSVPTNFIFFTPILAHKLHRDYSRGFSFAAIAATTTEQS